MDVWVYIYFLVFLLFFFPRINLIIEYLTLFFTCDKYETIFLVALNKTLSSFFEMDADFSPRLYVYQTISKVLGWWAVIFLSSSFLGLFTVDSRHTEAKIINLSSEFLRWNKKRVKVTRRLIMINGTCVLRVTYIHCSLNTQVSHG